MARLEQRIADFVAANLVNVSEEGDEWAALCPFHKNLDTPALFINKKTGLWHCFNPSCGAKGRFASLVKAITGEQIEYGALDSLKIETLESNLVFKEDEEKEEEFDLAMDRISIDYRSEDTKKLQYLVDRGFSLAVLEHFEIGFSDRQQRIVIPVRDESFRVVGFIGRAVNEDIKPKYKYSEKFPRRNVLLNLCNAKQYETVIVVEGSLDHIKVHQAGFPNVVSTMGSTLSAPQTDMLKQNFSSLIIFSDNDDAGDSMKRAIMDRCAAKEIFVIQYPEGKKDPGEMQEKAIQDAIHTRITHLEYLYSTL